MTLSIKTLEEADSGGENRFMLIVRLVISEEQKGKRQWPTGRTEPGNNVTGATGFKFSPFPFSQRANSDSLSMYQTISQPVFHPPGQVF
jgi:hypothetical protein